jgi:hypothetical protein
LPITTNVVVSNSAQARYTTLCDKVCWWLATGRFFSPGTLVSSTNRTDHHDITEILLKVALSTINQTKPESTLTTRTCKVFFVVVKWICWYASCLHRLLHTVFYYESLVWIMVLNATFNNISVISWWSVLLVEETRVPGENNRPVANYWPLFHIMLYRVHQAMIARYGHSFTYRFKELVVYLIHNQTSFVRLYLTAEKKVFFAKPVSRSIVFSGYSGFLHQ